MKKLEPIGLVRTVLEIESRWYAQREHAFKILEESALAVGKNPNTQINARLKTKFDELAKARAVDCWISIEGSSYSTSTTVKVSVRAPSGQWEQLESLREKFGRHNDQYVREPGYIWITANAGTWGSLLEALNDSRVKGNYLNDCARYIEAIEKLPELYRVHDEYSEKMRAVLKEFGAKFDAPNIYHLYGNGTRAYEFLMPTIYDCALADD